VSNESDMLESGRPLEEAGAFAEAKADSVETEAPTKATKARPARAKTKSNKADGAPRSRRIPLNTGGPSSSKRGGPPSRRFPIRKEASIPPTWSDLDDRGERIARTETIPPVAPAPSPAKIAPRLDDDGVERAALSLGRPSVSPYLKAAGTLAMAVCLVLAGRGLIRRARPLPLGGSVAAGAVAPPAAVDPIPPVPETIEPSPSAPSDESAEQEKTASLVALEQGKVEEAVAAGERATALDPTDADAWRILGAAYEDQGSFAAARRCYQSCTKSATRGDVRECTLLLQR
jgi:TPR repeat